MAASLTASELEFLMDGLDLLSALFSGPGDDCPGLVAEHVPAFTRDLGKAPKALAPVFAELAEAWSASDPAAFCRHMESEYVRIFLNTKGGTIASLYHSAHEPGSSGLMGQAAETMSARLAEHGLDLDVSGEPPDHLCVEIEFLAHLLASSASGQTPPMVRDFAVFMRQWIPAFAKAVAGAEPPRGYAAAARTLDAVIEYLA